MAEPARACIACLAWGSLIWKSGSLRLRTGWAVDGPRLPVEFVRVGDRGELATTLWAPGSRVATRWAVLDTTDLDQAREMLALREEIDPARPEYIGMAVPGTGLAANAAPFADEIAAWAARRRVDAVVWTSLPPRFDGQEGRAPTVDEAVAYLQSLRGATRDHAHGYIRGVAAEIRTPYRAQFEARLGLTPPS